MLWQPLGTWTTWQPGPHINPTWNRRECDGQRTRMLWQPLIAPGSHVPCRLESVDNWSPPDSTWIVAQRGGLIPEPHGSGKFWACAGGGKYQKSHCLSWLEWKSTWQKSIISDPINNNCSETLWVLLDRSRLRPASPLSWDAAQADTSRVKGPRQVNLLNYHLLL